MARLIPAFSDSTLSSEAAPFCSFIKVEDTSCSIIVTTENSLLLSGLALMMVTLLILFPIGEEGDRGLEGDRGKLLSLSLES